jgi:cell division protease FtsH
LSSTARQIIFWLLIIAGALLIYKLVNPGSKNIENIDLTQLDQKIKKQELKQVVVKQTETVAIDKANGKEYHVQLTNEQTKNDILVPRLILSRKPLVDNVQEEGSSSLWWPALYYILPFLLIFGFWIFMLRQMQSGGNKALSFGKSRAKLLSNQQKRVTFKDVAGVEEAKEELQEIIEFLKEPQKFQKLGGRIPKGVLMMGPPGTGKTLLARASRRANVPFFRFQVQTLSRGCRRGRRAYATFRARQKNAPCNLHRRD